MLFETSIVNEFVLQSLAADTLVGKKKRKQFFFSLVEHNNFFK